MLTLDDHTLQLQWDPSKINKGFQDLERKFAKLSNMDISANLATAPTTGVRQPRQQGESPLSNTQRDTQRRNIEGMQIRAEKLIAQLRKINTKEAQVEIRKLESVVNSLNKDLEVLAKVTDKNSDEFRQLGDSVVKSKRHIMDANKEVSSMTRRMNNQLTVSKGLTQSLNNLARSWVSVFAIVAGVGSLKRITSEMENISVASLLASGNAEKSAKDLLFVDELTERLGLRYKDTAKAFATFNVGAISGGVDPKEAKEVFVQISEGLASAGTSADSAKLAFLGFRQMISGSVVQAQEINQIVDQVPAFSGAAVQALDEMGLRSADHFNKATKSFKDTIKTAGVDAKEFTKIVARILSDQGRTSGALAAFAQSVTAEENRMVNATNKAIESIAEAGLEDVFKNIFGGLANLIGAVTPLLQGLGFAFGFLSEAIARPFRWLDKFAQKLGMDEGEGIQWAIRALISLLLFKLVPSLKTTLNSLLSTGLAAEGAGKGFFNMAKGAMVAKTGVTKLNLAAKALMRTLWPLLVLEGIFRGGEMLFGNNTTVPNVPQSNSNNNASQVTNDNRVTVNMVQTDGESPEEFGRRTMSEMGIIANSQIPLT